jgi:hypothetical protein
MDDPAPAKCKLDGDCGGLSAYRAAIADTIKFTSNFYFFLFSLSDVVLIHVDLPAESKDGSNSVIRCSGTLPLPMLEGPLPPGYYVLRMGPGAAFAALMLYFDAATEGARVSGGRISTIYAPVGVEIYRLLRDMHYADWRKWADRTTMWFCCELYALPRVRIGVSGPVLVVKSATSG